MDQEGKGATLFPSDLFIGEKVESFGRYGS
jgi:hypothetical protein